MQGVIGTCSICGADVIGHTGPWFGVIPPPPGRCSGCGATEAQGPVLPMIPKRNTDDSRGPQPWTGTNTEFKQ